MAGLFNADTQLEDLLERQRQQNVAQQEQFGQLFGAAAGNRRQAAANTIGAQIGASFGQGLAGGILGESEQIQQGRADVAQEKMIQERLGAIDWGDPAQLAEASKLLLPVSPEAGIKIAQSAIKLSTERKDEAAKQAAKNAYIKSIDQRYPEEALALRTGDSTVEDIQDRILKREEFEAKAPKIVSVTDGNDIVNLQWRDGEYKEISRGAKFSPTASTTVNLEGGDLKEFRFLRDNYTDAVSPIKADLQEYNDIETALDQGTGVSSEKVTSGLARLFGAKSNSIQEVTRFQNTGALDTRIASRLVSFFAGDKSAAEKEDIRALLDAYAKDRKQELSSINERAIKDAEARGVSPTLIVGYNVDTLNSAPQTPELDPRFNKYLED